MSPTPLFPRAAALAELGWSPAAAHDRAGFLARMPAELGRYAALGLPHATHIVPRSGRPCPPAVRDSHELKPCSNAGIAFDRRTGAAYGKRPVFLHAARNPCWICEKADLTGISQIQADGRTAAVQLSRSVRASQKVVLRPPATPDGELEVHLDTCDGAKIAVLPMPHRRAGRALGNVCSGASSPQTGVHDLCLLFTRAKPDPYWALHTGGTRTRPITARDGATLIAAMRRQRCWNSSPPQHIAGHRPHRSSARHASAH